MATLSNDTALAKALGHMYDFHNAERRRWQIDGSDVGSPRYAGEDASLAVCGGISEIVGQPDEPTARLTASRLVAGWAKTSAQELKSTGTNRPARAVRSAIFAGASFELALILEATKPASRDPFFTVGGPFAE